MVTKQLPFFKRSRDEVSYLVDFVESLQIENVTEYGMLFTNRNYSNLIVVEDFNSLLNDLLKINTLELNITKEFRWIVITTQYLVKEDTLVSRLEFFPAKELHKEKLQELVISELERNFELTEEEVRKDSRFFYNKSFIKLNKDELVEFYIRLYKQFSRED